MTRRGSEDGLRSQAAMQRLRADLEDVVGAVVDRLDARLERIENDAAAGRLETQGLRNELNELRRDTGELRSAVTIGEGKRVQAAAQGAAAGAASTKKWWEKWQAWAVAFVALVAFYKNVGMFMRDATDWWRWVIGEHPPAEVRRMEDEK